MAVIPGLLALPAPLVFATCADHVSTPPSLFNRVTTIGTPLPSLLGKKTPKSRINFVLHTSLLVVSLVTKGACAGLTLWTSPQATRNTFWGNPGAALTLGTVAWVWRCLLPEHLVVI